MTRGLRHVIRFKDGIKELPVSQGQPVEMDGLPLKITLTEDKIYIGCSDVDVEALEYIMQHHKLQYGSKKLSFELQLGIHPC